MTGFVCAASFAALPSFWSSVSASSMYRSRVQNVVSTTETHGM